MKRILFIKANPIDTADLRLENEENCIREALERSSDRENFVFETRGAVTVDALLNYLLTLKPNILHISGHGSSDEMLFIEGEDGYKEEISISKLTNFLTNFLDHMECLFLNACHSLKDIDNLSEEIPYIIGMRQEIPNDTAIDFSTSFYNSYFNGRSVKDSYKVALDRISLRNFDDELIPRFIDNKVVKIVDPSENTDESGPVSDLENKLVSLEEIELVKEQNRKKLKFYKALIGVCAIGTIGIATGTYFFFGHEILTTLGGFIPGTTITLPIVEINKNKKRIDLLNLFELKRKRMVKALSNLTESDVENINYEFEKIITT